MRQCPHRKVVAAKVLRPLAPRPLDLGDADGRLQGAGHLFRYPVLEIKKFVECAVEA
jgi:hypothetical protein